MVAQLLSSVLFVAGSLALHGATAFHTTGGAPRPAATRLEATLSRRDFALAAPAVAAAALAVGAPPAAQAAALKSDKVTAAKFAFNGVFRDNKHPRGYRIIAGGANKAGTGTVTLKDTQDGSAIEAPLVATRDGATGRLTLNMDLSAYGATLPETKESTWYQLAQNPKLSQEVIATVNEKDGSIRFPDGNVWRKEGGVVGVYIDGFAPYPKFRRLVLPGKEETLASVVLMKGNRVVEAKGADLSVVMVSGKKVTEVSGVDLGKRGLQVQFPGKACAGTVDLKQGTIAWADGNVWTKI